MMHASHRLAQVTCSLERTTYLYYELDLPTRMRPSDCQRLPRAAYTGMLIEFVGEVGLDQVQR